MIWHNVTMLGQAKKSLFCRAGKMELNIPWLPGGWDSGWQISYVAICRHSTIWRKAGILKFRLKHTAVNTLNLTLNSHNRRHVARSSIAGSKLIYGAPPLSEQYRAILIGPNHNGTCTSTRILIVRKRWSRGRLILSSYWNKSHHDHLKCSQWLQISQFGYISVSVVDNPWFLWFLAVSSLHSINILPRHWWHIRVMCNVSVINGCPTWDSW